MLKKKFQQWYLPIKPPLSILALTISGTLTLLVCLHPAPSKEQKQRWRPWAVSLEARCMSSKPSVTKASSWWDTFVLLTETRTLPGTCSGPRIPHRSGCKPNTFSKMKTPFQVLLRKNKKDVNKTKENKEERSRSGRELERKVKWGGHEDH